MSLFETAEKTHLLLPHELSLVERDLDALIARQAEHSLLLGEAMTQTSETFHDNAPADAIRDDQEVIVGTVKPILFIMKHHVVVDYPEPDSDVVGLGSRAMIRIDGSETFAVDVVGYRDSGRDDTEVEQVSYLSPIGSAILTVTGGGSVNAQIGAASKHIEVCELDQAAIRNLYCPVE